MRLIDGEYEETRDNTASIVEGLTAAGGPLFPPNEWFTDPGFDRPSPISVTADGRVSGHIASWETDHIGLPPGTKPPRSASDYSLFKTGVLRTDSGDDIHVGQLTLAGGHASLKASAEEAVKHYDDTASAVADVTVGEDEYGIWVSGGLRPDVTDEKVRALRASAPSGDWRPVGGSLELVAVCQVNTPGFPVARAMVASGEITALVAAGASTMYDLQQESRVYEALRRTEDRVEQLEAVIAAGLGQKNRSKFIDDDDDDDAEDTREDEVDEDDADLDEWEDTPTDVESEDDAEVKPDAKDDVPDKPVDRRKAALRDRFRKVAR